MTLSTHVLDTAAGVPAAGVAIELLQRTDEGWLPMTQHVTDADGRVAALLPPHARSAPGEYRLVFDAGAYFERRGVASFYSRVTVDFVVRDPAAHHHVPLLLSPFGYSTYRGT